MIDVYAVTIAMIFASVVWVMICTPIIWAMIFATMAWVMIRTVLVWRSGDVGRNVFTVSYEMI